MLRPATTPSAAPADRKALLGVLTRLGGFATWSELGGDAGAVILREAVADGAVERLARGRYALPSGREGRRAAHRLSGVAVGLSAAAHWGLPMKWQPARPQVAVPRGRRVPPALQADNAVSWRSFDPVDVVDGWVTSPMRTVLDCARLLPFDEALAVADSALRLELVTREGLQVAGAAFAGRGRRSVCRVLTAADGRAANPFESVLRAICLDVPGLTMTPQVVIRAATSEVFLGRVDLADVRLRIIAEADSYEFHGDRELMERDCCRYDELALDDWLLLRFPWPRVMRRQVWVRSVLTRAVALQTARG